MGTALVTGASGGIGSAVAAALTSAGYQVTALGRDSDRLRRLRGHGSEVIPCDFTQVETLQGLVGSFGSLDALVHCAGVSHVSAVADTGPAIWQQTLSVNVTAAAEVTRLTLPGLRRARGHVVFVNASVWARAAQRWGAFVGSKAALREVADSLRAEEAPNGIRVTTIYPAGTATDLLRQVRAAFGRDYDADRCIQPRTLAEMILWVLNAPPDAYVNEMSVTNRV